MREPNMSIVAFVVASAAAFALIQFYLMPELEGKWRADRTLEKLSKVGTLAALKAARTFVQIALVIYCLALLGIWLAGFWNGDGSVTDYTAIIDRITSVKTWLSNFQKNIWGPLTCGLACIALMILAYRRQKDQLSDDVEAIVAREYERLQKEHDEGKWEKLEPTYEMKNLIAELARAEALQQDIHEKERTKITELKSLEEQSERLRKRLVELDLIRRMKLDMPTDGLFEGRERWWPSISLFLTSKSMAKDADFMGKAVSRSATVLMCLCLVGVSTAVADGPMERRLQSLWDLKVMADQQAARASWESALAQAKRQEPQPLTAQQTETVDSLARLIVQSTMRSPAWSVRLSRDTAYHERSAVVADEIIRKTKHPGAVSAVDGFARNDLRPEARADFKAIDDIRKTPQTLTAQERWVSKQISDQLTHVDEPLRVRMLDKIYQHIQNYGKPAPSADFVKVLIGKAFDPLFDGLTPETGSDLGRQGMSVVSKGVKAANERALEIGYQTVLRDLAGSHTVQEALIKVQAQNGGSSITPMESTAIADLNARLDTRSRKLVDAYHDAPAAFMGQRDALADSPRARTLALELYQMDMSHPLLVRGRSSYLEPAVDYFDTYEDYFPSRKENGMSTLKAEVSKIAKNEAASREPALGAARAYSFEAVSAFRKTGGVVIGRPAPSNSAALTHVSGVAWSVPKPDEVEIFAVMDDGKRTSLGTFDKSLAYAALRYASDRRPLTVTIIPTHLDGTERVLLHPALVDTHIGCEIIQLDHLIFYNIDKGAREEIYRQIGYAEAWDALYRLAMLARLEPLVTDEAKVAIFIQRKQTLDSLPQPVDTLLKDAKFRQSFAASPVKAMSSIYTDQALVGNLSTCSQKSKTRTSFEKCIVEASGTPQSNSEQKSWLQFPPKMSSVSGVRESAYKLNDVRDLHQAIVDDAGSAEFSPIEFLVQAAYGDSGEEAVDKHDISWLFANIMPVATSGIAKLYASNSYARALIDDTRRFTRLQRFFRLAFDGGLGTQFEVESLSSLADALESGPSSPRYITASWIDVFGAERRQLIVKGLEKSDASLVNVTTPETSTLIAQFRKQRTACSAALRNAGNAKSQDSEQPIRACDFGTIRSKAESLCNRSKEDSGSQSCDLAMWLAEVDWQMKQADLATVLKTDAKPESASDDEKACRPVLATNSAD
ncbi:hypothetical protein BYI23_D015520 (plasmid) [Burkholderia sp. YI23]|nr:hypothetical protein BYI23_D015520 [Burkholderia sp. YI23]